MISRDFSYSYKILKGSYLYLLMIDIRSIALLVVHICKIFVQTVLEAVHGRSFHDRLQMVGNEFQELTILCEK